MCPFAGSSKSSPRAQTETVWMVAGAPRSSAVSAVAAGANKRSMRRERDSVDAATIAPDAYPAGVRIIPASLVKQPG